MVTRLFSFRRVARIDRGGIGIQGEQSAAILLLLWRSAAGSDDIGDVAVYFSQMQLKSIFEKPHRNANIRIVISPVRFRVVVRTTQVQSVSPNRLSNQIRMPARSSTIS